MILGHFNLIIFLLQLHLRGPIGGRFVPVVMLVRHLAENHEVHLGVAVRVDLNGAMVAAGDVRPDAFAEVADFWRVGYQWGGGIEGGRSLWGRRYGWRGEGKEGRLRTLGACGFLLVHGEFAVWGEEAGVVVVDVGIVGDGVVLFDEAFDGWVGDGVG